MSLINKTISDKQIKYLIDLIKGNHIQDISLSDNILTVTKNGKSTEYDLSYDIASTTNAGLMSSADRVKLNGIVDGAEPNQNAFAAIKFNDMAIMADTVSDIMHVTSDSNINFDVSTEGDSIVIGVEIAQDLTESDTIPDAKIVGDTITNECNNTLSEAKNYVDNIAKQKSQVQIITWGVDD